MNACPSAATLARLGLDSLRVEASATLEDHIRECLDCQAELNRLLQNDAARAGAGGGGGGPGAPDLPARDDRPELPGFVIERELGRGSMGVVYLAQQPSLGRWVALKVVRSGPAAGSREYSRWLREGRSFSRLRHENVVRLHEIGQAGGWLYLVLEYIPGGTLGDRLDAPYEAADAARLLAAIADAVEAIHRAGLLHLDLKPSNILMDAPPGAPRDRATPLVGDFGLAYLWDDPDATSNTIGPAGPVGTPRYMAPEQIGADRGRLGPAADVYGLGALLYRVLTGRPPFVAPSVAETLEQVRDLDPVPPRRLNPAIPRDLETICLKCLRKEPAQRYASAEAVADDLRRFLDGAAIAARPASAAEKTWRWCRRRPTVAALAAALMLALSGGFLGMFLLWRHAESQRGLAEAAQARAEAAQSRSEADFGRAADLLGELIELNAGVANDLPQVLSPARKIDLLQLARRNLVEFADRLPDRRAMYSRLMAVDRGLVEALSEESREPEVRALLEVSLRDAEDARRQLPAAEFPRDWIYTALHQLADLAAREGRSEDVEALRTRAAAVAESEYRAAPGPTKLSRLIWMRRSLASTLAGWGRRDEARDLLLANLRTLDEVPPDRLDEVVVAMRALVPFAYRHLGFDPPPGPRTGDGDDARRAAIAELGSSEADRLPADAWARVAARALGFDDPARPPRFRPSRAVSCFAGQLHWFAAEQRQQRHLDQAGRTADRLMRLARLAIEREANDPEAHLLLADAHDQAGKYAWQVHDMPLSEPMLRLAIRATIELNLRRAIAANRHALELDPQNLAARRQLELRQRKLERLLHPPQHAPVVQSASR